MKHDSMKQWRSDELYKLENLRKQYDHFKDKGMWRTIGSHFSVSHDSARNAYIRHMQNKNRLYKNKNKYVKKATHDVKIRSSDSEEPRIMLPLWEPFLEYRDCSDSRSVHEDVQNSIKEWIDEL